MYENCNETSVLFFARFAPRLIDREYQMMQGSMKSNEKLPAAINVSMNNPK